LLLQWSERGSDLVFGPHQASDGSLRLFALTALLLQPEEQLPDVLILDEPELGLHPFGIRLLAGALEAASNHCQILVCTQSMPLINHFEPEAIIVVDRPGRASSFRRLDGQKLADWLQEYSLAELWEKNVIGGRP
jgi:predicted ATPase